MAQSYFNQQRRFNKALGKTILTKCKPKKNTKGKIRLILIGLTIGASLTYLITYKTSVRAFSFDCEHVQTTPYQQTKLILSEMELEGRYWKKGTSEKPKRPTKY